MYIYIYIYVSGSSKMQILMPLDNSEKNGVKENTVT